MVATSVRPGRRSTNPSSESGKFRYRVWQNAMFAIFSMVFFRRTKFQSDLWLICHISGELPRCFFQRCTAVYPARWGEGQLQKYVYVLGSERLKLWMIWSLDRFCTEHRSRKYGKSNMWAFRLKCSQKKQSIRETFFRKAAWCPGNLTGCHRWFDCAPGCAPCDDFLMEGVGGCGH